jgi:hypothetical protein
LRRAEILAAEEKDGYEVSSADDLFSLARVCGE